MNGPRKHLVIGFPQRAISLSLVSELLNDEGNQVWAVGSAATYSKYRRRIQQHTHHRASSFYWLDGDPEAIDLGLSSHEVSQLSNGLEVIHHMTAWDAPKGRALVTLSEAMELGEHCKQLHRFVHWSTVFVAGTTEGLIQETQLPRPEGFRSRSEQVAFDAEALVYESTQSLPTTIFRLGLLTGDSHTGQIPSDEPFYQLMTQLLNAPAALPLSIVGDPQNPAPIVSVDYVVKAAIALSAQDASRGQVIHLLDAHCPSIRAVFQQLAKASGRSLKEDQIRKQFIASALRLPIVSNLSPKPHRLLQQLATPVRYQAEFAEKALAGIVVPPSFASYAPQLVKFMQDSA